MTGPGRGSARRWRRARGAIAVGGALLALLASGAAAEAAPFANGSFETPVIVGALVQRNAPFNFGDWMVTAGTVDQKRTFWQHADGGQSIDLNGVNAGTVCQTFDTPILGTASVSFMMSHNPDASTPSGTLRVLVNGVQVGANFVHNAANSKPNMLWQSRSAAFTVSTATSQLCFESLQGTAQGPALDAVTFTPPTYASVVGADGPLAWYRLGESSAQPLIDSSPSNKHGACVNGVTFGLPGIAGTARGFDGRAAYCYANNITAPTSAYTIEGWMKLSAQRAGTIAEHGSSGSIYVTTTQYCMKNAWEGMCVASTPTVGVWHHVAASWSASDKVAKLYVDGVLVMSAVNGAKPSGSSTFYVGYGQNAPWFTGTIDEVAYYPTRLSDARIATHYSAGCGC